MGSQFDSGRKFKECEICGNEFYARIKKTWHCKPCGATVIAMRHKVYTKRKRGVNKNFEHLPLWARKRVLKIGEIGFEEK